MIKINLIEYFETTLRECAGKTAVWDKEREITFDRLGKIVNLWLGTSSQNEKPSKRPWLFFYDKR